MTGTHATVMPAVVGMGKQWIKNIGQFDPGGPRKTALSLVNAAFNAIDTDQVLVSSVSLQSDTLRIKDQRINLARFRNIWVIGIGKAAHQAAVALERILGSRVSGGIIVGTGTKSRGSRITCHQGTHPMPSAANVRASRQIVELSEQLHDDDLALVIVSGGGSSSCAGQNRNATRAGGFIRISCGREGRLWNSTPCGSTSLH